MTKTIAKELKVCGIPPHIKGYDYLGEAIEMVLADHNHIHNITKTLYPTVAKKFKTTTTRVERAIRHAIEVSFDNLDPDTMFNIFGNTINYHRGKPTNSHFIAVMAELVAEKIKEEVKET
jgi:two-component system response regulator (stage 0 sporulation protein A)